MSVCGSVRGMDTWDPRVDAHVNANFNTYQHGIGGDLHAQQRGMNGIVANGDARQVQIMRRDAAEKKITKLFITGVPRRCTTTSLEEMFAKYGEVVEIGRSADPGNSQLSRLWVTYGSFREATAAIEALDGVMIDEVHQLRVAIALSEEEIARRKRQKIEEEAFLADISQRSCAASPKSRSQRSCVGCGKVAGQQCGSCKEPYCSRECQTQDWAAHRGVCAKKKLQSAKESVPLLSSSPRVEIRTLKIGSSASLSIFDATDPSDFAVLDSADGDLRYISMESTLAGLTASLRRMPSVKSTESPSSGEGGVAGGDDLCSAGRAVLAFFEEQFSRAIVIKSSTETVDGNPVLWFTDYGNTASTPYNDIRPLPAQFAELPSRVVPCALANVVPKNGALVWPADVQALFKQLLLKDLKIVVKECQSDSIFPRHKVDIQSGDDDLATVFVNGGYADWIRPPEAPASAKPNLVSGVEEIAAGTPEVSLPAPFHLPSAADAIQAGDALEATIVYHARPGLFFIWKVDDQAIGEFAGVSDELNRHFAASQPDPNFAPAVGDYVAAWVVADGQWCRARVTSPKDGSGLVSIRYVDYGEDAALNPAQLRPLTAALLHANLPALAICCATTPALYPLPDGAGEWSPASASFVEEQFPVFGRVNVEVVEKTADGIASVVAKREDGVSFSDLMVSSGHASTRAPIAEPAPSPPLPKFMAECVPLFALEQLSSATSFPAIIPHLEDWQNLYVQPFTDKNKAVMINLNDEITKAWQGRTQFVAKPEVGELLLAKDVDGSYYRAVLESVDDASGVLSVRFLDYGNVNTVLITDCLPASPDLVRLPILGFWAPLDEGVPYDVGGAVTPVTAATITSQPELEIRLSANAGIVEILTQEKQDLLKTLDLPAKKPAPKAVNLRAESLPACPFIPPSDAPQPISILITDVQSLQRVFVQCLTDDFLTASEALAVLMAAPLDPVTADVVVGDLLAVPFTDGCLYRAEVLDVQDDGNIAVHFVDYGNCYVATRASALALPPRAEGIPPLAFPITLNDEAYVIPTGTLDVTTVAHLTVETPTYNITIPSSVADTTSSTQAPPSKRPSINAVVKDAVKTLNVLDVLAAAGVVKPRTVQSPTQATSKPSMAPSPASPISTKFRADVIPSCPYVPEVGEAKKIVITEVISLAQIYVQVVVPEFLDVLSAVEASILEMGDRKPEAVEVGDLVLALFEDGAYYRAEILEIVGDDAKVHFVDYGNLVTVAKSQLKCPSEKLAQYPRLCFAVKLSSSNKYSVNSCDLDDCILSWMKNPAPSFDLSMVNAKSQSNPRSSPLAAKIVDVNGASIVDCLGDAGYLKAKSASPSETALTNAPSSGRAETDAPENVSSKAPSSPTACLAKAVLAELPFPDRGDFLLSHFNSPGEFFLQNEDCIVAAVKLQSVVDAQVAASKSFAESGGKPDLGALVLSQFEGVFYRAVVLSIKENDVVLHFIDYGNEANAPPSAIYPSSDDIRNVPKLCFRCTAAEGEVTGWSADDVGSLRNVLPEGCFFTVEKIRPLSDQRHLVAPAESRAEFDAIVAKYAATSPASVAATLPSAPVQPLAHPANPANPVPTAPTPTAPTPTAPTPTAPTPTAPSPTAPSPTAPTPTAPTPTAPTLTAPTPTAPTPTAPTPTAPTPTAPTPTAPDPGPVSAVDRLPNVSDMTQGHQSLVEGASTGCDINEFISPFDFHLSLKEEAFDLLALTQDLMSYGPSASPLLDALPPPPPALLAGTVVVALWSEGWYRAALLQDVLESKPETVVDVRFIDYGNCDQVALKDVRQILPNHFGVPIQSLRCRLSGIGPPAGTGDWSPDVQMFLQESMISGAVSACNVRKFNADSRVFLVILLFNDVAFQKTLVEKGLATKIGGAASTAAKTAASVSVVPPNVPAAESATAPATAAVPAQAPESAAASALVPGPAAAPAPSPTSSAVPAPAPAPIATPAPALAPSVAPVPAPACALTPVPMPDVDSEAAASRSVSVIPKNGPSTPSITTPLSMVPRSVVKSPNASAASPTAATARPPKTIAVSSLQIGSESRNVVMNVAGVKDIAILMPVPSELPNYAGMEETILGATQELMTKRGMFDDPERQLRKGGAVLALFEGQLYRAVVTAAFEDEEPDKIKVWFVDYGNSATLLQTDLVDIPVDLLKLPALCAPCALRGVLRPQADASKMLNDIVNAEVVVRCHEVDGRGAVPKMIVTLLVEGVDVAVSLRNEGVLELLGDEEEQISAVREPSFQAAPPRNVDINNNVLEAETVVAPAGDSTVAGTAAASSPGQPVSAAAAPSPPSTGVNDEAVIALKEENKGLKEQLAELEKKNAEASKKIDEMAKKMDVLKSLI